MLRAPNRGPTGLRIPDVQAFNWQSSEASSKMHGLSFRLARRAARGIGGSVSYTLARSRDNASTLGGGRTAVAQNDQDLDAEWGLSWFDRRHQLSANASIELPFGPNRPWLNGGGWAALAEGWRANTTSRGSRARRSRRRCPAPRATSPAAPTARCAPTTPARRFSSRPDDRSVLQHRRVLDSGVRRVRHRRPEHHHRAGQQVAQRELLARRAPHRQSSRRIERQRNLLNLVQYAGLDTNANSPTFGQITSVRPMRSMTLSNFRY